jgi:TfoX/Sxy family transcriptional regulator of competence genes
MKQKAAMPKWTKAPDELVAAFTKAASEIPGASVRKMFGYPAAFLAGNMFAGIFQEGVIVRLPQETREGLVEQGGRPFEPMPGRVMKEYVVLPENMVRSPHLLHDWIGEAASYARTLAPKAVKATKPSSRA